MSASLELEELLSIYRREPTVRDVVVEGLSDQILISWFLSEAGVSGVAVYQQSSFVIPSSLTEEAGVENNNRGRVIALAAFCEVSMGDPAQITCVADTDFDLVLGVRHDISCLIMTDYANLEMYFYTESHLNKYLAFQRVKCPLRADRIFQEIQPVLTYLFAARMANARMTLGMQSVDPIGSCQIENGTLRFDANDYLVRYLNKNAMSGRRGEFQQGIDESSALLQGDPRFCIHGHDFLNLLSWYLAAIVGKKRATEVAIFERAFAGGIEFNKLLAEGLFVKLLSRVNPLAPSEETDPVAVGG